MNGYLILLLIAVVFLPGILWASIDSKLGSEPKPSFAYFVANSFVFGVLTYLPVSILVGIVYEFEITDLVQFAIEYTEAEALSYILIGLIVIIACGMFSAVIFALLWLRLKRAGWLYRILKMAIGDGTFDKNIDAWNTYDILTHLMEQNVLAYVRVWDYENKKSYDGYVEAFVGRDQSRDIFLNDVIIKDYINNIEENRDFMFIALPMNKIFIEFIKIETESESGD